MPKYYIILFLLIFTNENLHAQCSTQNKVKGEWLYYDRWTFEFLSFCDDHTFILKHSSCTQRHYFYGNYSCIADTIFLQGYFSFEGDQPKHIFERNLKFFIKNGKIFTETNADGSLDLYASLTKTTATNLSEAYQLCKEKRLINELKSTRNKRTKAISHHK